MDITKRYAIVEYPNTKKILYESNDYRLTRKEVKRLIIEKNKTVFLINKRW